MGSKKVPLVSVVMPVFNAAPTLQLAIESVQNQDCDAAIELIIVDDGSTDSSLDLAKKLVEVSRNQVTPKLIAQARQGASKARNTALKHCGGSIIAFLDADDFWPTNKLAWQLRTPIDAHTICLGAVQRFHINDKASISAIGHPWKSYQFGAMICSRETIDTVGFLDEQLTLAEDFEWFLRARDAGITIEYHDQIALWYRIGREGSLTYGKDLHQRKIFEILHRNVNRRREGRSD